MENESVETHSNKYITAGTERRKEKKKEGYVGTMTNRVREERQLIDKYGNEGSERNDKGWNRNATGGGIKPSIQERKREYTSSMIVDHDGRGVNSAGVT